MNLGSWHRVRGSCPWGSPHVRLSGKKSILMVNRAPSAFIFAFCPGWSAKPRQDPRSRPGWGHRSSPHLLIQISRWLNFPHLVLLFWLKPQSSSGLAIMWTSTTRSRSWGRLPHLLPFGKNSKGTYWPPTQGDPNRESSTKVAMFIFKTKSHPKPEWPSSRSTGTGARGQLRIRRTCRRPKEIPTNFLTTLRWLVFSRALIWYGRSSCNCFFVNVNYDLNPLPQSMDTPLKSTNGLSASAPMEIEWSQRSIFTIM